MRSYVLDSFAMIAYFEDEPGADKVAQILTKIQEGGARGYMSVINWGEIYYNTMRGKWKGRRGNGDGTARQIRD